MFSTPLDMNTMFRFISFKLIDTKKFIFIYMREKEKEQTKEKEGRKSEILFYPEIYKCRKLFVPCSRCVPLSKSSFHYLDSIIQGDYKITFKQQRIKQRKLKFNHKLINQKFIIFISVFNLWLPQLFIYIVIRSKVAQ